MAPARKPKAAPRAPSAKAPRPAALADAVSHFLSAAGLDPTRGDLRETPRRVAELWASEFLDGYGRRPEDVLAETFEAEGGGGELVIVTDIRFHSMCPHHLVPYLGKAHLAYVPGPRVVGFGRLAALVDCFAHRLILQEDLARSVARALSDVLGSPAAACILQAEQLCLRLPGDRQHEALTHAEAYEGALKKDGSLRRELWARIGGPR
jgi:GTP cyclohydrolase I